MNKKLYKEEILLLKSKGYLFIDFDELKEYNSSYPIIILRHDIDFSLANALEVAVLDKECEVKSNFFFQLNSPLYNLLSSYASEILHKIHSLGHSIGLHFDFCNYPKNELEELEKELLILKEYYPFSQNKVVSFHRTRMPLSDLQNIKLPEGILHTYDKSFSEELVYLSDSKGILKLLPSETHACNKRLSMQILFHPIWWIQEGQSRDKKISNFLKRNRQEMISFIKDSAITFDINVE